MHWTEAARKAKGLLPADTGHGGKQLALAAVARQLGLERQSLRNILAAFEFLESTKSDQDAYRSLAALPNTSVEVYAKWHRYDPASALEHAKRAAAERLTVKAVIAAEKEARALRGRPAVSSARSLVEDYRASGHPEVYLHEAIRRHLRHLGVETGPTLAWSWDRVDDAFSLAVGIREAMTFFPSHEPGWRPPGSRWRHVVGVLEVGERALGEGYRKLSKDVMARSIAGTLVYPAVLVVAPDSAALAEMTDALPPPFRRQGGSAPPEFFVLAPGIGGIMFTAADRARHDLYQ